MFSTSNKKNIKENVGTVKKNNDGVWMFGIYFVGFIAIMLIINALVDKKIDNFQNSMVSRVTIENTVEQKQVKEENNTITEFISTTSKKGFVEAETTKKFVEMMKWCSEKDIYNKLFSKSLKEKLTLEQFKNYKLNSFGIEGISAMLLADDSVYISFIDSANGGAYGVKVKDKAII